MALLVGYAVSFQDYKYEPHEFLTFHEFDIYCLLVVTKH